ncbi:hypothetical protein DBR11_16890 [Pedobacter sp. HMWF019]|uniref:hypothetical protein n=1 Tax=Pedobacter sp. HMWF019 TaxID=2056856 RepID=UPI000D351CEA|nr:hypothetical protein [Pedobacter sp. HMWF019]PTS97573.1 hypothetical protein DBR11_16890 [Pedobacter sp. HMWF019]
MKNKPTKPDTRAQLEALKHPNGYVYVIEENYANRDNVPPSAILGAWKVNKYGIIEGGFISNSNYKNNN